MWSVPNERQLHVCRHHNLILAASSLADNEQLDRYAIVLCLNPGIVTLVFSACLKTYAFLLLYKHLGWGTLFSHFETYYFVHEQCYDVYGTVLDAPDILYKILTEELFVKKKILGDMPILRRIRQTIWKWIKQLTHALFDRSSIDVR